MLTRIQSWIFHLGDLDLDGSRHTASFLYKNLINKMLSYSASPFLVTSLVVLLGNHNEIYNAKPIYVHRCSVACQPRNALSDQHVGHGAN
jgi:hypothetical protein